jgi:hypothetical protein
MKLPNGERAIVDRRKLEECCLNPHHPRGRNKAKVSRSRLEAMFGIAQCRDRSMDDFKRARTMDRARSSIESVGTRQFRLS